MKDKYSAIWVSHSSMSDYLKCPRAYFLRNVYRDPKTNHKIDLVSPSKSLGAAVHDVLDSLSRIPRADRFTQSLIDQFNQVWQKYTGKLGGFRNEDEEEKYKKRGLDMITRVSLHPGPLTQKAIKIRQDLPFFWLSEEDNIILCGKLDWLEYREASDSVRIIDFKTGKFDEDPDSMQLPIYHLLAIHCQRKPVTGASYWYLDRDDEPMEITLADVEEGRKRVLEVAKKVALARKLGHFKCKQDGCISCRPYEAIVQGRAELIGINSFGQDLYFL